MLFLRFSVYVLYSWLFRLSMDFESCFWLHFGVRYVFVLGVCVFEYVLICFSYVYTFILGSAEYKDIRHMSKKDI